MALPQEFQNYLYIQLSQVDYVQLDNLSRKTPRKEYEFLIRPTTLQPLLAKIKTFSETQSIRLSSTFQESKITISFKNGQEAVVHFVHKLVYKALQYLKEDVVLSSRVLNHEDVYIPSIEHLFEYTVLKNMFNREGFSREEFRSFSELHILIQEDSLEYFNVKYGTTYTSLYQLTDYKESQKQQVLKYLKQVPSNRFIKKINVRWHSFLGYMKQARII